VLLVALAATPARGADFEGVLEGRLSGVHMNGTYHAQVGKDGVRAQMEQLLPEKQAQLLGRKSIKSTSLWRRAQPDRIYLLDEDRKTYSVIHVSHEGVASTGKYTVRRLGKDRVAGLPCEKVEVRRNEGRESEMCVCSEFGPTGSWAQSLAREGGGLFAALKQAGVEGFPIRWRIHGESGEDLVELVSAKRQRVPASALALPAGYREAKGRGGPAGGAEKLTPEQRRKLEEALKGMKDR
jgi:hypothetical protein